jgi:RNA polymerase-associated protein RTF1
MSDFEDDIDDQLLELAGATEKKKKRRQHSNSNGTSHAVGGPSGGSKKRKAEYALFIKFKAKPFLPKKLSFFWQLHLFREMNICWFMASVSFSLLLISFLLRRMEFDSEKEPIESEEDEGDPYPLEGKYKDEVDRREWVSLLDD